MARGSGLDKTESPARGEINKQFVSQVRHGQRKGCMKSSLKFTAQHKHDQRQQQTKPQNPHCSKAGSKFFFYLLALHAEK